MSLKNLPLFPGVDTYTNYTITRMGLKPLNVKPIRIGYGLVINDVSSFHYPIDTGKCKKKSSNKFVNTKSLFIGIISAPGNFEQRNDIRRTWLLHFKDQQYHRHLIDLVGFCFFLGTTSDSDIQNGIEQEAALHKDIIQVDMMDGYFKVSKKDAALLNWIKNNCSRVDFVLKVDDDVYLNIRNLATTIEQISPSRNFIYGLGNAQNITDREGKWKTNLVEWPWLNYPSYLLGAIALIPGRKIESLLAAAQTIPYYHIEDVYLTGLCRIKAKIEMAQSEFFFNPDEAPIDPDPCFVRNSMAWLIDFPLQMQSSHKAVEQFYRNVTHCKLNLTVQVITNPDDVIDFEFY